MKQFIALIGKYGISATLVNTDNYVYNIYNLLYLSSNQMNIIMLMFKRNFLQIMGMYF